MQTTSSMAKRIREITDGDSLRAIAARIALHGGSASPQAVQKWLQGGRLTDANIEALARAYRSTPEYIKFGTGPAQVLTERQSAAAELVADPEIE